MILAKSGPGIRFNEHMEGDGPTVFAHACKMGLEGIVSKRKDSPYRSGRSLAQV
jgi:bifunctional non-homologous end joining protein LigD